MKIFAIHRGKDKEEVKKIKEKLEKCPQIKLLILEGTENIIKNKFWKREARKLIKEAEMVVYFIGDESNANIDWEIKIGQKYGCEVIFIRLTNNSVIPAKYTIGSAYDENKDIEVKGCGDNEIKNLLDNKLKYEVLTVEQLGERVQKEEDPFHSILFNKKDKKDDYNIHLMEQYKIFLDSTEKLVDRRQLLTTTYLTLVTALVPVVLYLLSCDKTLLYYANIIITSIAIYMSYSWEKMIESYGKVSSSKYAILQQIEKELPMSILLAEWAHLSKKSNNYISFTKREKSFPRIFMAINIVLLIVTIVLLII